MIVAERFSEPTDEEMRRDAGPPFLWDMEMLLVVCEQRAQDRENKGNTVDNDDTASRMKEGTKQKKVTPDGSTIALGPDTLVFINQLTVISAVPCRTFNQQSRKGFLSLSDPTAVLAFGIFEKGAACMWKFTLGV